MPNPLLFLISESGKTDVHRLRRRLQSASDHVPPIRTVRGVGYRLDLEVG